MPQQGSEAPALGLKEVDVSLDMKNGDHSAVARLGVGFGDSKHGRPILTALLEVDLLSKTKTVTPSDVRLMDEPVIFAAQPGQGQADAAREHVKLTAESLALSWLGYAQGTKLQLLPGMDVLPESNGDTGYAVFTFTLDSTGQAGAGDQVWNFAPESGFVEALLNCRAGGSLFDVGNITA